MTVAKRDYKSYGILDDDIAEEVQVSAEKKIDLTKKSKQIETGPTNIVKDIAQIIDVPELAIISEVIMDKENQEEEKKVEEITGKNDTSFDGYKEKYASKKHRGITKWTIRFLKLVLFLMLLPFICIVLAVIGAILATVAGVIIACIGSGLCILGAICFMSSQISGSLITLGVMSSIALLSLGGIISILTFMFMKGIVGIFHRRKLNKKANKKGGQ